MDNNSSNKDSDDGNYNYKATSQSPPATKTTRTTAVKDISDGNKKENNRRYKILIVDDERDITSVVKKGLKNNGFEADSYNDPILALEKFRAGMYDLLIIDIKMPKMNGFELYKKMKDIDSKVKVCFLTAIEYYTDEFRMVFPKLTVRCFADKPISIDLLAKKIRQELEGT